MADTRAQLARDLVAAVLILIGTAVLTWGAWQIDRAAGGIVGGILVIGLGVALGFGEVGSVAAGEASGAGPIVPSAVVEEGLTPPEPVGVGADHASTSSAPAPASPPANLPPDPRPTQITIAASRWIGPRGDVVSGDVPIVQLAEQAARAEAMADPA